MYAVAIVASLLASAFAVPAPVDIAERQTTVCSGTYSNAQCCATDVLGIADLDCANPPSTPANVTDFVDICEAIGQQAECCILPIAEQGILCEQPTG